MALKKDAYRVLGIAPICSSDEVHTAYRTLSKEWHPDVNPNRREVANERMQELVSAYTLLKDAQTRKDYDGQTHFKYKRNLTDKAKSARPRLKIAAPSFLTRLGAMFSAKVAKSSKDPVVQSQEHFAMGLSMADYASFLTGAKKEFQMSAELDPSYLDAHYNVGIACYRLGQFDESINAWQRVLSIDKNNTGARTMIQLLRDHEF